MKKERKRQLFLLEIYLIACSVSASFGFRCSPCCKWDVRLYCKYALHGVTDEPKCLFSSRSPHVNYKFYLFIFLRHFSSTYIIEAVVRSSGSGCCLCWCWAAREQRSHPMTYSMRHDVNLGMCERRSRKWVAKCDNCLFYSVFIDNLFSSFRFSCLSLRAPFRSEKSELIGTDCAYIFPKFVIKPYFFWAHGANNIHEIVSFHRNRAGIGQAAYDGKKSTDANGKLLIFGLIYHVFVLSRKPKVCLFSKQFRRFRAARGTQLCTHLSVFVQRHWDELWRAALMCVFAVLSLALVLPIWFIPISAIERYHKFVKRFVCVRVLRTHSFISWFITNFDHIRNVCSQKIV